MSYLILLKNVMIQCCEIHWNRIFWWYGDSRMRMQKKSCTAKNTPAGAPLLGFVEYFSKALHEGRLVGMSSSLWWCSLNNHSSSWFEMRKIAKYWFLAHETCVVSLAVGMWPNRMSNNMYFRRWKVVLAGGQVCRKLQKFYLCGDSKNEINHGGNVVKQWDWHDWHEAGLVT